MRFYSVREGIGPFYVPIRVLSLSFFSGTSRENSGRLPRGIRGTVAHVVKSADAYMQGLPSRLFHTNAVSAKNRKGDKVDKKQFGALLLTAVMAGLVRGTVSSWFLVGSPVFAQKTRIIDAEVFLLRDIDGRVRASLYIMPNEGPRLEFSDEAGKIRAAVGIGSDEKPFLGVFSQDRKTSVELEENRLRFFDHADKVRAVLGITPEGIPALALNDPAQKARITLNMGDGASPSLNLYDRAGKLRSILGLDSEEPALELFDKDGKTRAALGGTELEDPRTGEKQTRAVSSLMLFDKDGKVLWHAP